MCLFFRNVALSDSIFFFFLLVVHTIKKNLKVVENPRFGVGHTLRTLGLHAAVLYLGAHLARLGWNEFFQWGGGPIGQILLSPSPAVVDGDVIDLNGNDSYGYFWAAASTSTDPERCGSRTEV